MCNLKRLTALVLTAVMVLALVGCGGGGSPVVKAPNLPLGGNPPQQRPQRPTPTLPAIPAPTVPQASVVQPQTPVIEPLTVPVDNTDRDSLEQIAQLVGGGGEDSYAELTDEELTDLIEEELQQQPEPQVPGSGDPVTDPGENTGEYDENGAMVVPFDQIYPELVETEQVRYDDQTLLLKLPRSMDGTVTDAMGDAGIARLELLFELETGAWYEAWLLADTDVPAAVQALREIDSILTVDYNYQVRTADLGDMELIPGSLLGNPRAEEQWYLGSCGIPSGMAELRVPGGSPSIIVAVIDTGVDYDHQDLAGNIWVNEAETPDDGVDNDGNGYIDDYYGVNIVSGTGSGDDDNGHGTHVAGIIAARNNNLGTVGIAYNVKIMPIKAAMSSGYLNQADIARAVLYAHEHGAEVINMSFGGTACSIAVQDALALAYTRSVLVASAGNDGAPNQGLTAIPNYPAALSYVLGVMSVDSTGMESAFSNYDTIPFNGVEYELYAPGEFMLSTIPGDRYASWSGTSMAAPVVSAMAALLRSEFADRELYPTKFIYGQLTGTSEYTADCLNPTAHQGHITGSVVNLYSALTTTPQPEVGLSEHYLFDTQGFDEDKSSANNGDGVIDAGETIALGLVLRNRWGKADDTIVTLDTYSQAGISDPYITIHNESVNYGSVGTYSDQDAGRIYTDGLLTGWEKPFYITIAPDCPNDYVFRLNVTITCRNGLDAGDAADYVTEGEILLTVRSGKLLPSVISEDTVLTNDSLYIIPSGTVIQKGITVEVEPGTRIQFWSDDPSDPYADTYIASLCVNGILNLNGTKEEPVLIYPADSMDQYGVKLYARSGGELNMTWTEVTNLIMSTFHGGSDDVQDGYITTADHCTFRMNYPCEPIYGRTLGNGSVHATEGESGMMPIIHKATNCVFYKCGLWQSLDLLGYFERCIFADCAVNFNDRSAEKSFSIANCVFLGNHHENRIDDYRSHTSTLQIPETAWEYDPQLNISSYFRDRNVTLIVDLTQAHGDDRFNGHLYNQNAILEMGGELLTIDNEDTLAWFEEGLWQRFRYYDILDNSPTPAVGVTYDRVYVLSGDVNANELEEQLKAGFRAPDINPTFNGNVLLNRTGTDFDVNNWLRIEAPTVPGKTYDLSGNYWGTTNERTIGLQLTDYSDFPAIYSLLEYKPFLTEAPENTFPFVTDVTIYNKDWDEVQTVANEEITVRISFNRDMDMSIPLSVQYGSSYPYRDYTIEGDYIDARTWEGTKLLTTVIENGTQYFVIENGCSAEGDLTLCTDEARFAFELDTAAAQALIMQGEARADGIYLSWTQDDFDTLMGYHLYRSDSEDGYYQRINDTIIPADTKEFLDQTVEPGQVYYYNFTVVQTDLTESIPSGKITLQALDTMAPNIYHTPVYNAHTGSNLVISATITDNLHITSASVHYRIGGESQWRTAVMTSLNSKYTAIIPADHVTTAGLDYYIEATDGVSTTARGSAAAPYHITVTQAQDLSSLGDVNGDGKISNLDALMLLQAINDLVNLTAEQFERADLNADGQLTASEALRILQYVSGAAGSLNG